MRGEVAVVSRLTLATTILFYLLFYGFSQANAHGTSETIQLNQVLLGTHTLSVWTSPSYLRIGEVHFAAILLDDKAQPVSNQTIDVILNTSSAAPTRLPMRPASEISSFRYETETELVKSGDYNVTIAVQSENRLEGTATFSMAVSTPPFWMQLLIYLASTVIFIILALLLTRSFALLGLWHRSAPARRLK